VYISWVKKNFVDVSNCSTDVLKHSWIIIYIVNPSRHNTSKTFLVNDQRDTQIPFYVFISIYNSPHVSNTSCSSSGETNCINTASGNSHSILVAALWSGWKKTLESYK